MAKDKPAKYWRFKLDTRRKFTELSQEIARINSGSGADIDLTDYATKVWVEAKGYITASALTPYALKTDIPSLVGYATEDFVNNKLNAYTTTEDLAENYASKNDLETAINNIDLSPYLKTDDAEDTYATKDYVTTKLVDYAPLTSVQGFENRIGGLEGAVPRLNARVETVESKVATLNEYVVTGGNNLLNRVNVIEQEYATKTYVDNAIDGIDLSAYLLKADLTKSRIQSTLGISDWALASVKPTYTASEVGALAQDSSSTNADLDTILDSNTAVLKPFFQAITGTNIGSARKGVLRMSYNGSESQLLFDHYNKLLRYRTIGENPKDWATIAFTSDIPTKLSQLTDDVVAGKYLPLSGGTLTDALTVKGSGSPLTVHRTQSLASVVKFVNTDGVLGMLGVDVDKTAIFITASGVIKKLLHSGNYSDYALPITGGTINGSITATSFIGNLTGNADSATKLKTRCKLWGNDFDGTGDVSGTFRQLYTGSYGGAVAHSILCNINEPYGLITRINGNGDVLQQAQRENTNTEWFNFILQPLGGNVGIGTTSPTEKLDVAGNVKASGNINATSITINGVTITASNGTITVNGNVFATGAITAKV